MSEQRELERLRQYQGGSKIKTCTRCKEEKPLALFSKNNRKRDGYRSQCKSCDKAYRAENAERIAAYDRDYQFANRESMSAYNLEYQQANAKTIADHKRDYRQARAEVWWAGNYRSRIKKYGIKPVVEDFTRSDVVSAYGDTCVHCGGPFEHLDHYPVPVALGGSHTLNNVRPSCAKCNLEQGMNIRAQRKAEK